jgi:hypothetical protein
MRRRPVAHFETALPGPRLRPATRQEFEVGRLPALLEVCLSAVAGTAERLQVRWIEAAIGRESYRLNVIDMLGSDISVPHETGSAQRVVVQVNRPQSFPGSVVADAFATSNASWCNGSDVRLLHTSRDQCDWALRHRRRVSACDR